MARVLDHPGLSPCAEDAPSSASASIPRLRGQHRSRRASRPARFFDAPTAGYPFRAGAAHFGEWLVRRGAISRAELFTALDVSFRHGCRLGDALVWLDVMSRGQVEQEARRHRTYAGQGASRDDLPRAARQQP